MTSVPAREDTDDYRALFLGDVPIMDMRSPGEFNRGSFPCAHSLPLMSDDERARVGTCYKKQGQQQAIALGHQLVSGEVRAQRLCAWQAFARQHPQGYLYCFRGGLRSSTVQRWLRDEGIDYPLVRGGYKAMRRFLLEELERIVAAANIVLIAGKTGVGKTRVIEAIPRAIDLEGLACHRGSTFGQLPQAQPSQIDFENSLIIALMKLLQQSGPIFLEDEGRLIGRCALPDILREKMAQAPMVLVEQDLKSRVKVVLDDYIVDLRQRFAAAYGEQGDQRHEQRLQQGLYKIRRRLGGARHQTLSQQMTAAFEYQRATDDISQHQAWIKPLLQDYYDPMYEYQQSHREGSVIASGTSEQVISWARDYASTH